MTAAHEYLRARLAWLVDRADAREARDASLQALAADRATTASRRSLATALREIRERNHLAAGLAAILGGDDT